MSKRKVSRRSYNQVAIGDMREPIQAFKRDISPDNLYASYSETQSERLNRWASVETVGGKHIFDEVNTGGAKITHIFTIRYDEDIDSESIIVYRNNNYLIDHLINHEERNMYLKLYCHLEGSEDKGANQ